MTEKNLPDPLLEMQNPAADSHKTPSSSATEYGVTAETRIAMSVPRVKLAVRDIPGSKLYWFKEENIESAIQAGYEYVKRNEVHLNRSNPAGSPGVSGNTDLGTNVSLAMGTFENGQPQRLVLMKIRLEWYKADQLANVEKQAAIIEGMFEGQQVLGADGTVNDMGEYTYIDKARTKVPSPIFNRKPKKAKVHRRG